ncbi:ABC transporter ATP-binding protein [Candidatus Saccharibacteria bacterium]|nr:MAG: ABC transporter ATP-binding protein [Candidatus Saccharibacteria bacterium]
MKKQKPTILVKGTLKLYWEQIRLDKLKFWVMTLFIPLAALMLDTAVPYYLAKAIGTFSTNDTEQMQTYLFTAGVFVLVGVVLNLIGFQTAVRHEAAVRTRLVVSSLDNLLRREQDFFANQKIGALTGKFIDFINGHVGIQDLFVLRTLSFLINLVVGLTIIFLQTPLLAGIIAILIVGLLVQIRLFRQMRDAIRAERKRLVSEVNGTAADSITNNLTVKTFAGEKEEVNRVLKVSAEYEKAHRKDFSLMSLEGSGRILFMQTFQIIAIIAIGSMLLNHSIPLSIAIFTIAYLQRLAATLFSLGELINGYDKILLQASPMTEILQEPPLVRDRSHKKLHVTAGAIDFTNVYYAYQDTKSIDVLHDFTLHIKAGQKVGLVGSSGAGKTTVTKLLLRFDDLDNGSVLIDGQNIADVTQASLRQSIAYVAQEPLLFHRSLAENIAYAHPYADIQQIRQAASEANALEFIERLPNGFDTIVGERGVKLSGGQRQRIAIARAILKNAPILVLDEATSALDSKSEQFIQRSLAKLMENRTSLVVAHRLSTIAKLDRIVVLDNGRVVEDGSHADLLAHKGIYAKLWAHQSGGFIEE